MKCFADVGVKGAKGCAALTEKHKEIIRKVIDKND